MNEVLKVVLSLSLAGTILIAILYFLQPIFKERLSKRWQYYIWLVVITRLLLPFVAETNLMGVLFQEINRGIEQTDFTLPSTQQANSFTPQRDITTSIGVEDGQYKPESNTQEPIIPPINLIWNTLFNIWQNLWLGWLVVGLLLLIRKITVYQSFVKYIRAGCVEVTDIDILERFGKLVEQNRIKKTMELYTNNLISSPLLIGFFRSAIIIPSTKLSQSDFKYTILHELIHYKRHDMLYKWMIQFTICVHWFNPFVYLMGQEVSRTCELSCDETVIRKLDEQGRRAYGDTLLNAIRIGGNYKDSLASVTLNESKELLKERLDAIMNFKRKSHLCAVISVALVFTLCFGATVVGAYNITPPKSKEILSTPSPTINANLTLIKKEYTMDELKTLDISGVVVNAFSEDITIVRGGDTLKFEYYKQNQNEYTLQREDDSGKTRWNLCLIRATPIENDKVERPITVTIPDKFDITLMKVQTDSGDINFENCIGKNLIVETKTGQININGGSITGFMIVQTDSSNALIVGTSLPNEDYSVMFETNYGIITYQPKDSAENHCFIVQTGLDAQIAINGKKYTGGDYEINGGATKKIYFDTLSGSLIVQDLSYGKLSLPTAIQLSPVISPIQPTTLTNSNNLTLVKKEYTENELQQMGITGLCIEATTENIVVNQGGTSLILIYYQANGTEYTLNTRDYEIYNGEFTTPEDITMNGGKSGMVKELQLANVAVPTTTPRTIYITLPADPKYSRVVQLFSDSGNIQMEQCKSTAMISADTQSGNISFKNCSSPRLGVGTLNGNIEVSDSSIKELNAKTRSGTLSLLLADHAQNYKMIIDTRAEAQISINGKRQQSGEFILNPNASNIIYFDCYDGSLVITEKTTK